MFPPLAQLAFGMPSMGEWTVILIIGVMIYGRRLPDVGRQLGRTVAKMRRGFDEFRREMDRDENLRDVHSSVREVRDALHAPMRALDPRRFISDSLRDAEPKEPTRSMAPLEEPDPALADQGPHEPAEPSEEARRSVDPTPTPDDTPPNG